MLRAMSAPALVSFLARHTLRGVTYLIVAAGTVAVGAGLLTSTAPLAAGLPQDTSTAAVGGPWVAIAGVYGTGRIADFTAADAPAPGVSILQPAGDGSSALCTTGWAVLSARHDIGYLTAGHCDQTEGAPLWMYTDANGQQRRELLPLQNAERGDDDGRAYDAALFFLSPDQQSANDFSIGVAEGVHLRGVMPISQARGLAPGTPICMHGSRSGVTCGPLIAAGDDEVLWGGAAVKGDSGAPVFVVNDDGDALAVGTLAGGPAVDQNYATYLAPVLNRLQLRAIVEAESR